MRTKMLLSVVLIAVTLAVFMQTANHQFITYDDPGYVATDPVVKEGLTAAGFAWAFTTTAMSNWRPLTWLSHMAELAVTTGSYLILNNYGAALNEQGRIDESIVMFQQALSIKSDHAEALYNLGRLYLQDLNRPEEAFPLFTRAIAVKPDYIACI